ncbi:MAG: hypothetical protein ACTSRP_07280 [Candidatus Helarchaeota archaeon]
MYYTEELIIRYESLIGKYNRFFTRPMQITDNSIKLFFSAPNFCLEFMKCFLTEFNMCKLQDDSKTIEIKVLNLYNIESILKSILNSLEKALKNRVITINRNCYYGY